MKPLTISARWALALMLIAPAALLQSAPRVEEKVKDSEWHVVIDRIPASLDEFRSLRDAISGTPQGGIAAYLVAHLVMIGNPDLGERCLVLALDMGQLARKGPKSRRPDVDGWEIGGSERMKMSTSTFIRGRGFIAKSYVSGTSTAGGYALPSLPYTMVIRAHRMPYQEPDFWKGMVATSCTDSGAVPIHVKKNNRGIWKVINSSSFYSGCKPPPSSPVDDSL